MSDYITVVTSGWHIKETIQVPFQPGDGLLQIKDRVRAALGSAAQGQVGPTLLHSCVRQERPAQDGQTVQNEQNSFKQQTYLTACCRTFCSQTSISIFMMMLLLVAYKEVVHCTLYLAPTQRVCYPPR